MEYLVLNDEILYVLLFILFLLFLLDRGRLRDFVERNKEELKQRSNYGKLKKYH